jgi:Protein of unknown function (DUF3800)
VSVPAISTGAPRRRRLEAGREDGKRPRRSARRPALFHSSPPFTVVDVYLAYVDESGKVGRHRTRTFSLACALTPAADWFETFDRLISFRRWLRERFGVPIRAELKANHILRNEGAFESLALPEGMRHVIYRQTMRLHHKIGLQTFAVLIDKEKLREKRPTADPRDVAWEYLLQRLERASVGPPLGPTYFTLIHDAGESDVARRLARKARRAGTAGSQFGTGFLRVPFERLVDDPVPRDSRQSYFVQLADLAAYAAFRRFHPPPARLVPIVPQGMSDELGPARYLPVTTRNRVGIVRYPA